ncbi:MULTISPECIES: hypothetical protein [Pseudonocardia]|uniref:Uncharacterized protein n=2 Tax=Pseudonocardia TaxID=1847 RepID=A0A1Y2N7W8_PSEAH|nr:MULTISPECIES: hypothetical protein [Pseudonocardia]OSY43556.1 hypothetical protein BG845_00499 [Pseudonocardia autotrophica]TDN73453.1 hypothetical protein C8E95_2550 [Pseudonocardia autotrophica]BBG04194.1 hypothetical protein Pdca_54030 [Pseudonocardia autotrophica]GEC25525.1 hypothetical protein PSA01_25540 [Pseudonocardia saturnea]
MRTTARERYRRHLCEQAEAEGRRLVRITANNGLGDDWDFLVVDDLTGERVWGYTGARGPRFQDALIAAGFQTWKPLDEIDDEVASIYGPADGEEEAS